MDAARLKRLQAAGWKAVTVEEFLREIGADNRTKRVARLVGMPKRPGQKPVPIKAKRLGVALPAKPRAKAKRKTPKP